MSEQTLLQMEVDELRHIFDLVWSADMRAVKRWQDAGAAIGEDRSLGNYILKSLTWPVGRLG